MAERYHDGFMLRGKIPAKSNFFQNWKGLYTSSKGIYEGVNTVLGEQLIVPNDQANAPIYKRFLGRPMYHGDAWMERVVVKVPQPTHFTGKEGADEAFKFYNTDFLETVHKINFSGTRSVSLSDNLLTNQINLDDSGAVNDYIVDRMSQDIQRELEEMAGTTLVMQITKSVTEDLSTPEKVRDVINRYAIKMKSSNLYADLNIQTDGSFYAKKVVAIMTAETEFNLTQQPAVYPNAGVIRTEADVVTIYGTMPSGLTDAEYKEKAGDGGSFSYFSPSDLTKSANPPGLNRKSPDLIILDADYFEIRPYLQEWSIDTSRNAKGRFTNVHASYVGAMGIKPWRSAVCISHKAA